MKQAWQEFPKMHLYFVLGCIFLHIEVSRECALPFWWRDQFPFTSENPESLKPRTSFRYRSTIHRTDPNNFVHVQEYSQFTWWEHDTTRDNTNRAISKDGSINGISPGKTRQLSPIGNIKGGFPTVDGSINGMIPKGVTKGMASDGAATNGMIPGSGITNRMLPVDAEMNGIFPEVVSVDSETNRITPGVFSLEAETNGMVPRGSSTNGIFNRDDDTREILNEITSKGISIETTNEVTTEATRATTETTRTTTEVTSTTTTASFTEVPEREPLSPDRERNEKENVDVLKSENLESNDLEASDASKSSSELKVKEPRSRGRFFGSWFGKRIENETEPCQVAETDIHSLRSMIERMFSNPREHVKNAGSKEKAREDILNKFRNYGLQVWTQNFTTPLMMNPVRHIIISLFLL